MILQECIDLLRFPPLGYGGARFKKILNFYFEKILCVYFEKIPYCTVFSQNKKKYCVFKYCIFVVRKYSVFILRKYRIF